MAQFLDSDFMSTPKYPHDALISSSEAQTPCRASRRTIDSAIINETPIHHTSNPRLPTKSFPASALRHHITHPHPNSKPLHFQRAPAPALTPIIQSSDKTPRPSVINSPYPTGSTQPINHPPRCIHRPQTNHATHAQTHVPRAFHTTLTRPAGWLSGHIVCSLLQS